MKKEFSVSEEIYSQESISQAITDFSEVSEITYDAWMLVISGEAEDEIYEIFHEFMNYVLSI